MGLYWDGDLPPLVCMDDWLGECEGPVEFRIASGESRSTLRCGAHGQARMDQAEKEKSR